MVAVGAWGAHIHARVHVPRVLTQQPSTFQNSFVPSRQTLSILSFSVVPAAPHPIPGVLQGPSAGRALRGARGLALSSPKPSGKMHQFEPLSWISLPVARGQRDAQRLADGWTVTAISGCFCLSLSSCQFTLIFPLLYNSQDRIYYFPN